MPDAPIRADGAVLCACNPVAFTQTPHQATSSLGLVVLAEDTHKTLLAHRICTDDDIYHRQGAFGSCAGSSVL